MSEQLALGGLSLGEIDELFVITSKMSERRRRFVFNILAQEKQNGKKAAEDAGFSPKSAEVEASRLLRDAKVRRALEIWRKRISDKFMVTAERVVQELAYIGFLNPREAYNEDGTFKSIVEMPEHVARAVSSVEMDELSSGEGKNRVWAGRTSKVKFWDKRAALELLGRKLGIFVDKHAVADGLSLEELVAGAGEAGK